MTDPYKNIPRVLPGSEAAEAVDEVGQHFAGTGTAPAPDAYEKFVKKTIMAHGGDPVTAATSAKTAALLAEDDPSNAQSIAEHVVGTTLADPSVAAQDASNGVTDRLKGMGDKAKNLTDEQQKALAFEQANRAAKNAGIVDTKSSQAMQADINKYIDQGMSPGQAAAAAVAAVAAQSVAMADAGSFSIFGYLTLLVTGNTHYIFKNKEDMTIANNAIHNHLSSTTYEMAGHDMYVQCTTIKTTASLDTVRAHSGSAIGEYRGSYKSYTPASFSFYLGNFKFGQKSDGKGIWFLTASFARVYLAAMDADMGPIKGIDEKKDDRYTLLKIVNGKYQFFVAPAHMIKP